MMLNQSMEMDLGLVKKLIPLPESLSGSFKGATISVAGKMSVTFVRAVSQDPLNLENSARQMTRETQPDSGKLRWTVTFESVLTLTSRTVLLCRYCAAVRNVKRIGFS